MVPESVPGSIEDLPGTVPPSLEAALRSQTHERRVAFLRHLFGGTSANFLSNWLGRAGTPVSATTIKRYRRGIGESQ